MYSILGFNKFVSKKGNACCMIQLSREYSKDEMSKGCCGVRVEELFLPTELFEIAAEENIGKSCDLMFNRNGFLMDVIIRN